MSLRTRLLIAFVSMALLVLVIFGVVSYRIALDSASKREIALLEDIAQNNAALLSKAGQNPQALGKLAVSSTPFVNQSGLLMFIIPADSRQPYTAIGYTRGVNFSLLPISQAIAAGDKNGQLNTEDNYLAWATTDIPGSANKLLLVHGSHQKAEPFFETVGVRLMVTAAVVIWVSVWGALLISATIARRLNQKQMELIQANSMLKQEMEERTRAEENARHALMEKLRAEASNQAKGHFLSHMGHELRTPLNVILGYSQMLEMNLAEHGQTDSLSDVKNIRTAGNHLLALTNELLDLSKIEAGKMRFNLEQIDIASLLEEINQTAAPLVAKNNNHFKLQAITPPGSMQGDPTKLRQILLNLLSNACKFTENGEISLSVDRMTQQGRDYISFTLSDTGIGMDQTTMQQLFEPFMQGASSAKHNGAGLGLTITKRLCEVVGGGIHCASEPGKGTTFTVHLPLEWQCASQSSNQQDIVAPAESL